MKDTPLLDWIYKGEPPAQRHSPTSLAAAASIKPRIGPDHRKILFYLRGREGATDEEMQDALAMGANTQRPRRRELELMGEIIDSGRVRLTRSRRQAVVWKVRPPAPSQETACGNAPSCGSNARAGNEAASGVAPAVNSRRAAP